MRVLLTGGAGFIGSHLCDALLAQGDTPVILDNLSTGQLSNIAHIQNKVEIHQGDIRDVALVNKLTEQSDLVLHMAAALGVNTILENPIESVSINFTGSEVVLNAAVKFNKRIIIASTSEIYGDPTVHPQTEDYWGNVNPVGPRGVYDEAKRFQEAITMAYHTFHGVETRIVRIFNTYGPRMRLNDGRVLPAFMGQALRGENLTVFGDGSQTRSFCYVDDLIEGIYRLLLSNCSDPVNVGNPSEITISQFAEEIINLTGTDQKVIYKDLPVDDPKQRQPDITKAKEILNWEPAVAREKGLRVTWEYFKSLPTERLYEEAHHRKF